MEQLARAGYIKVAGFIFGMLEWVYHTAITANNLAAFYEEYLLVKQDNQYARKGRSIDIATIKHYYLVSYHRQPNVKAACSLGYVSFQEKKYKKALFYYKKALKIKESPQLFFNIAVQYVYLEQYDRALFYLSKGQPFLTYEAKKQADLLLIYIHSVNGNKYLAREYFRDYINTNKSVDMDLLHLAYLCQEYDYIDRNCLSISRDSNLQIKDVEIVVRTLYMVGKEKLVTYFIGQCIVNPHYLGQGEWEQQCQKVLQMTEMKELPLYIPKLYLEPILHKKMYIK